MKHNAGISIIVLLTSAILLCGCSDNPVTSVPSADGVEISFSNQGKGKPAIVLVHGWTNNNTIWDLQIPFLSEKYQVIAIDLAGHGKSGNNREEWSISAFGEDIASVVKVTELDQVILVGFSLGGAAILEAAKIIPDQLAGLILIDAIQNPEARRSPAEFQWVDSTFMDLIEHPTAAKLTAFGFVRNDPELALKRVKGMIDRDQTGWREILKENFRWGNDDCISALKSVSLPLRAINSENIPTATALIKKYNPSFEVRLVHGSGHVLMWDATETFNRVLEETIQDILSQG